MMLELRYTYVRRLKTKLSAALATGMIMTGVTMHGAMAESKPSVDPLTRQAVSLFEQGKLDEARALEAKAIAANPHDWLPHAATSFFYWQEGDAQDAVTEGQKAVACASNNEAALVNLGHMYQELGDYKDAIPLYSAASKSRPTDWVPLICLTRCYVGNNDMPEALEILKQMAALESTSFAWHYQLGITYLTINKPSLAVTPLTKAVQLACLPEQKAAAQGQLLVSLLRDGRLEPARDIEEHALIGGQVKEGEPYVLSASLLLSASNPAAGKQLLQTAVSNLVATRDSDIFFRLGRIFEEKAGSAVTVQKQSSAWLANAHDAFSHAVELNPGQAQNHLALAAVAQRAGKWDEMSKQLSQASLLCASDPLVSFLMPRANHLGSDPKSGLSPASPQWHQFNLTAVGFDIDGLTCNCHSTRIDNTLRGIDGIALIRLGHLKPYAGTIFVDPAITSPDKAFSRCLERAFPPEHALKVPPRFTVTSQQAIASLDQAVTLVQSIQFGSVLDFPRRFAPIQPVLPAAELAQRSPSTL